MQSSHLRTLPLYRNQSTQHPPPFVVRSHKSLEPDVDFDPTHHTRPMQKWERKMADEQWNHWKGHMNCRGTAPVQSSRLSDSDSNENESQVETLHEGISLEHSVDRSSFKRGRDALESSSVAVTSQTSISKSLNCAVGTHHERNHPTKKPQHLPLAGSLHTSATPFVLSPPTRSPIPSDRYFQRLFAIKRLVQLTRSIASGPPYILGSSNERRACCRSRSASAGHGHLSQESNVEIPIRSYTPVYTVLPSPSYGDDSFSDVETLVLNESQEAAAFASRDDPLIPNQPIDNTRVWPHQSPSYPVIHVYPTTPLPAHPSSLTHFGWVSGHPPQFALPTAAWQKKVQDREREDLKRKSNREAFGFGSAVRRQSLFDVMDDAGEFATDHVDPAGQSSLDVEGTDVSQWDNHTAPSPFRPPSPRPLSRRSRTPTHNTLQHPADWYRERQWIARALADEEQGHYPTRGEKIRDAFKSSLERRWRETVEEEIPP